MTYFKIGPEAYHNMYLYMCYFCSFQKNSTKESVNETHHGADVACNSCNVWNLQAKSSKIVLNEEKICTKWYIICFVFRWSQLR